MKNRFQEMINEMTEKELLTHLYATQFILLTIAIILGMLIYRSLDFFEVLFNWRDWSILYVGITAGLFVVILDLLLMAVVPKAYYDDGGLNEKIFRNRKIYHIALIALIVAFSEELLFRGIIQTELGLIAASIIFALIHYRYLFNWFLLLNIITLSFVIGLIYQWTENLSVTFVMHFVIDFLLGCIIMVKNKKTPQ
jgi:uncharacterized protein